MTEGVKTQNFKCVPAGKGHPRARGGGTEAAEAAEAGNTATALQEDNTEGQHAARS